MNSPCIRFLYLWLDIVGDGCLTRSGWILSLRALFQTPRQPPPSLQPYRIINLLAVLSSLSLYLLLHLSLSLRCYLYHPWAVGRFCQEHLLHWKIWRVLSSKGVKHDENLNPKKKNQQKKKPQAFWIHKVPSVVLKNFWCLDLFVFGSYTTQNPISIVQIKQQTHNNLQDAWESSSLIYLTYQVKATLLGNFFFFPGVFPRHCFDSAVSHSVRSAFTI